jgi:hypothetical protein
MKSYFYFNLTRPYTIGWAGRFLLHRGWPAKYRPRRHHGRHLWAPVLGLWCSDLDMISSYGIGMMRQPFCSGGILWLKLGIGEGALWWGSGTGDGSGGGGEHRRPSPSSGLSYPVFMPKPSTRRMYAQDQLFHTYGQKVLIDNQISRMKYNYYIHNVSKD